jgi:hypothetical protein
MFPLSLDKNGETMFGTYRRNSEASGGICESLLNSKLCFFAIQIEKTSDFRVAGSLWRRSCISWDSSCSRHHYLLLLHSANQLGWVAAQWNANEDSRVPFSKPIPRGYMYVCICNLFSSSRVNRYRTEDMRVIAIISSSAMFVSVHSVGTVATYCTLVPWYLFHMEFFYLRTQCFGSGILVPHPAFH